MNAYMFAVLYVLLIVHDCADTWMSHVEFKALLREVGVDLFSEDFICRESRKLWNAVKSLRLSSREFDLGVHPPRETHALQSASSKTKFKVSGNLSRTPSCATIAEHQTSQPQGFARCGQKGHLKPNKSSELCVTHGQTSRSHGSPHKRRGAKNLSKVNSHSMLSSILSTQSLDTPRSSLRQNDARFSKQFASTKSLHRESTRSTTQLYSVSPRRRQNSISPRRCRRQKSILLAKSNAPKQTRNGGAATLSRNLSCQNLSPKFRSSEMLHFGEFLELLVACACYVERSPFVSVFERFMRVLLEVRSRVPLRTLKKSW